MNNLVNRRVLHDLPRLVGPEFLAPGWSAPQLDLWTAQQVSNSQGRREARQITVSSAFAT